MTDLADRIEAKGRAMTDDKLKPTQADSRPYAHCCNSPVETCDCTNPNHGTAVFKSICNIPNCRNYAPATEAFCSQHRESN